MPRAIAPKLSKQHKRVHIFYRGRVQGVGFRYTAETAALGLKLTGWVRNLPDGRVETVCEGSEQGLKKFLKVFQAGPMKPYIETAQVNWEEATGEFEDFQIRFYC